VGTSRPGYRSSHLYFAVARRTVRRCVVAEYDDTLTI
jgi:hypothetical protein